MNPSLQKENPWFVLWDEFTEFLSEHKGAILGIIFVALLAYGFELTHFTLGSDEEIEYAYNHYGIGMVGFGRFLNAFIDEYLHTRGTYMPYIDTFVAVAFLVMAALVFLFAFWQMTRKISTWQMILFAGGFLTIPFFGAATISIAGYNMITNLGVLLMVVALCITNQWLLTRRKSFGVVAVLLLGVTEGIYQSLITVYITGVILCVLLRATQESVLNFKQKAQDIGQYVLVAIAGMVVYFGINFICQKLIFPSNGYNDALIGWGTAPFLTILKNTLSYIWFLLTLDKNFGGIPALYSVVLLLAVCVWQGVRKRKWYLLLLPALGIFAAMGPFLLALITGSAAVPIRTVQALPILVGFAWFYLIGCLTKPIVLRVAAIVLGAVMIFTQAQALTRILYGDYVRYERDVETAALLDYDIESACEGDVAKPVVFVGSM
ncbi:MAG: glucosyltransferase domain-containing protein, partial [Ruthenibacterium sp.]